MWVYAWAERDTHYDYYVEYYEEDTASYAPNRFQRRVASKTLPPYRYETSFHFLLPRGLTRAQFLERASRLFILGRRRFYFILNRLLHLPRKLQILICGRVKLFSPFTDVSSEGGGLWSAHLWPG